jgi:hypothetical protein
VMQLIEPTVEEKEDSSAGLGVGMVLLILAALVSLTFVCVGIVPLALHRSCAHHLESNTHTHCSPYCEVVREICLYFKIFIRISQH